MDENKMCVTEWEYSRLCRLDGKVEAIIEYINEKEKERGYVDISVIKVIIGLENFASENEGTNV